MADKVYMYIVQDRTSSATREKIENHIDKASEIWDIRFEVRYGSFPHNSNTERTDSEVPVGPSDPNDPAYPGGCNILHQPNLLCTNRIIYNIVTQHRNGDFPDAEVIILYSSGRYFANGITKAVSYDMNREYPYFIHMSDGSLELDYIMAHEIGHIFNFTNRFDNKNEANPYEDPETSEIDYTHNNDPDNIMYPIVGPNPTVTADQKAKALESRIIK
ncbi:Uncharacterized protein BC141101_05862 [Bacillus toyonensis]|uniref:hypothetical protein n=1 Tax=Bacillus toyonensis TaxID=155322 RepID=UPI0002794D08|nr:hypothetical protein [Bacillus toyonensis]EJQ78324.1 hypothetical protein IGO_05511 [Bacillus toyonensis]EJR55443.1 hypothetical protein IK3_05648 [Bacillus toyonensis]EJV41904.1 hypothetical protein IEA_05532 [Bacillus toyonensis]EJV89917.1 hypothetical protein IGI_05561 [Bacillus toyonensis]EOP32023.1 hypothetical protein IG5_05686 [Bacillus toyonensis]